MPGLGKTTASLLHDRQKWQTLMRAAAKIGLKTSNFDQSSRRLREVHGFGSNPGALRMFTYLPAGLADQSALVVVLHGCAQTAASYEYGAGWSTLAERYGFALLLPEQQRANNPNGCFNWFQPGDTRRGQGEALSIRQMVDKMLLDHGIDGRRVYVTGLSAGGAMTSSARDLPRCLCRRGHDRRASIRRRNECPGRIPKHVSGSAPPGRRVGRLGATCVATQWTVAADLRLARRHGHDRGAVKCGRDRQAMGRCAWAPGSSDRPGDRGRLSA